jgi:3-methyladenine DNA glycosylase AlkC
MSNLLRDIYSVSFYNQFSEIFAQVVPSFNRQTFIKAIFDKNWESKQLKERIKHTSFVLHSQMPGNYEKAATIITELVRKLREYEIKESSIEFMFFPDYIETYGIDNFDVSVRTIEYVTQFTSCEFAVRPFIIKYGDKMIKQMFDWSLHENYHVRRLASEGTRPRLPWAMAIPELKKNPTPILPILNSLKNDPSDYVRRSVANNLNDITKDNPQIVISLANEWKGVSKETDAIIKHGCRTLLKKGNAEILKYFRLSDSTKIELSRFKILTPKLRIGSHLEFSFIIANKDNKLQQVRLEYAIYYLWQNGQLSKKVYQISERVFQPKEKSHIRRKRSFQIITTRKFYPGQHKLSIIINGQERATGKFELID